MQSEEMSDEQVIEQRKTYHHGDLREALIKATQHLIEERGVDNFSVSDACRLAGVSTAAPYKHFKRKEDMISAAVLDAMLRHRDELADIIAPYPHGSRERIVAMGLNYVSYAMREPGMFRLRFAESDALDENIEECGQLVYSTVQNEVRAALGEPEVNQRVRERAYMLWSFVHGLSYLEMVPELVQKGAAGPIKPLIEDVVRRILSD
jgi:AcrR family transcriptional regulator